MTQRKETIDTITGLLLEWGRTSLQAEKFPDHLCDIRREIDGFNIDADLLQEAASCLVEDAGKSLKIIGGLKIVDLTPADPEWSDVLSSLAAFDNIVFLMEGLRVCFGSGSNINAQTAAESLSKELNNITGMLFLEDFSFLRLTPYNQWRRSRTDSTEEPARYLFPWNDMFSDEPAGLILDLSEHYHHLKHMPPHARIPEYLQRGAEFYLSELSRDSRLHAFIQEQNHVIRSLEETARRHWSLRLWNAAKKAAMERILPENVEAVGLEAAAKKALQKQPSPGGELVMDVLQACYGPGQDEQSRIAMLLQLEDRLQKVKESDPQNSRLDLLVRLSNNEISAAGAANTFLDDWISSLGSAAESISASDNAGVSAAEGLGSYVPSPEAGRFSSGGLFVVERPEDDLTVELPFRPPSLLESRIGLRPQYATMSPGMEPFPAGADDRSNFLWLPYPGLRGDRPLVLFRQPAEDAPKEELACAIYSWHQEQPDEHSFFACFLDENGVLTKQKQPPPELLPRKGRPIQLQEIPESTAACIIVIGRSDHIRAEWDIWNEEKARPLEGESGVYIIAFCDAGLLE